MQMAIHCQTFLVNLLMKGKLTMNLVLEEEPRHKGEDFQPKQIPKGSTNRNENTLFPIIGWTDWKGWNLKMREKERESEKQKQKRERETKTETEESRRETETEERE